MFKFAFSVILVGAIYHAFVFSIPVDSSPSLSQRLEIVGKAAFHIFESAGDFAKSLAAVVKNHVNLELTKLAKLFVFRI